MEINIYSIFKLSSIIALLATLILLTLLTTGMIEVPIPAMIIISLTSISLVSVAFRMDKRKINNGEK